VYYGGSVGSVVISVRIPKELKEAIDRYGINVSEVVRSLLEKYVAELEDREVLSRLSRLRKRLSGRLDPVVIARLVREDRER